MPFLYALLLFCMSLVAHACEVVDDAGQKFVFKKPASRIISLAPDLTEILFTAGAGKKIVGVIQGSDYPPSAKKIPVVGRYNGLDLEKIVRLKPDLIVVWGESRLVASLKKLRIPVYVSHPHHLLDIPKTLTRLGCLAGTEKIANQAAKDFLITYQTLKNANASKSSLTVFYQVWPKPLLTITGSSWMNDVIELCGGKNIFKDVWGVAPEVSMESVIRANPDIILQSKSDPLWRHWSNIKAVKNKNIFLVSPDFLERAAPRILIGAKQVCVFFDSVRKKEMH